MKFCNRLSIHESQWVAKLIFCSHCGIYILWFHVSKRTTLTLTLYLIQTLSAKSQKVLENIQNNTLGHSKAFLKGCDWGGCKTPHCMFYSIIICDFSPVEEKQIGPSSMGMNSYFNLDMGHDIKVLNLQSLPWIDKSTLLVPTANSYERLHELGYIILEDFALKYFSSFIARADVLRWFDELWKSVV